MEPRTTDCAAPAQLQRGSEAAEGPEAALWTGDRRRWAEDPAPGGSRAQVLQGTDICISNMNPQNGVLGYGLW